LGWTSSATGSPIESEHRGLIETGERIVSQTDLWSFSATEMVAAIADRSTSCTEVAAACLDRVEKREHVVEAWNHIDPELTLASARDLDRQKQRGPLHGVPFGVKDIVDTRDMPTELGTPIHRGSRPARDATCVALSRRAGANLMGKTVTTEFANVSPGPTRNPLDLERTPGGSSSGSAAAVADMMVPIAIGTQTTGSTIRPASYCGVVGYRPTWADLSTSGVMEVSGSLDTLGILARSIEDVSLYRDVLLGLDPVPLEVPVAPPRIGLCRPHFWSRIPSETRDLLEEEARRLADAGATVVELVPPGDFEGLDEAHRWISSFEMSRNLTWEIENRWDELSEGLRNGRLRDGLACTHERYLAMRERAEKARRLVPDLFEDCDVLLTPAAATEAPLGWDPVPDAWVYMMWTILHVPVVTVPKLAGPEGLPIGVQVVGQPHRDRALLRAAKWIVNSK
jgi:amidase